MGAKIRNQLFNETNQSKHQLLVTRNDNNNPSDFSYFCGVEFIMKQLTYFLFIALWMVGCSPADRQRLSLGNEKAPITDKKEQLFNGQWEYDSLINVIDTTRTLADFYSLEYSDSHQNNRYVKGKLNAKNAVVMMEMEETYAKGLQINTRYYYSGDLLFYAQQTVKDYQKEKNGFMEVYSYFGNNKKVIVSASRLGNDEEDMLSKPSIVCKKVAFDPKEALALVNQKGKYETRFQGTLETESLKFIIVGTKGNPTIQTAIAYNKDFPLAVHLAANEAQYLNRLLKVEFQKVTGENGFTYQGLTRLKLIDENE